MSEIYGLSQHPQTLLRTESNNFNNTENGIGFL